MSARRMNCSACKGEPGEGEPLRDRGLVPLGVDKANEGKYGLMGSGVFGGAGGDMCSEMCSEACASVVELIHFSSRAPIRGGDISGNSLNASAKWLLMNL